MQYKRNTTCAVYMYDDVTQVHHHSLLSHSPDLPCLTFFKRPCFLVNVWWTYHLLLILDQNLQDSFLFTPLPVLLLLNTSRSWVLKVLGFRQLQAPWKIWIHTGSSSFKVDLCHHYNPVNPERATTLITTEALCSPTLWWGEFPLPGSGPGLIFWLETVARYRQTFLCYVFSSLHHCFQTCDPPPQLECLSNSAF